MSFRVQGLDQRIALVFIAHCVIWFRLLAAALTLLIVSEYTSVCDFI
jgi:hypothetical protein